MFTDAQSPFGMSKGGLVVVALGHGIDFLLEGACDACGKRDDIPPP